MYVDYELIFTEICFSNVNENKKNCKSFLNCSTAVLHLTNVFKWSIDVD